MGIFGRRKKVAEETQDEVQIKSPCDIFGHNYQDFPWYLEDSYDNSRDLKSQIVIYEPYCCHVCHKIKKVILWQEGESLNRESHDKKVKHLMEQFKDKMQHKAVVFDMINDMILVDRQKLKYWESLHSIEEPKQETEEERLTRYKMELFGGK